MSIKRELKEETGIEARDWRFLLRCDLSNSVSDEVARVISRQASASARRSRTKRRHWQLKRVPFDEAYEMVLRRPDYGRDLGRGDPAGEAADDEGAV